MTSTDDVRPQQSLGTGAARRLASTTKTTPHVQGRSPRWLMHVLPWVDVSGASYRVNRRLTYTVGDGRITFTNTGRDVRIIPQELREIGVLRDFEDEEVLRALADRFVQHEYAPGDPITREGAPIDRLVLVAHGKIAATGTGEHGDEVVRRVLADGEHFGADVLGEEAGTWRHTHRARTACTALVLDRNDAAALRRGSERLSAHLDAVAGTPPPPHNKHGEAEIAVASGHHGEPPLPHTYVDYETHPREYELSPAQTVLHLHTRVADLYNNPHNQLHQQLTLTIQALRERQEHELVNNPTFGLLNNTDLTQRTHTRTGPPTPDDLDDLLARRRRTELFLAHPRAIAAFGRECNHRGTYPRPTEVDGKRMWAWRGVPILPCDKIPVTARGTSSILAMRTGEEAEGVVGLHRTGLPDEYEPGLSVRFTGINDQAVTSYLVTTYYSAAVLVPDAVGLLEHVEVAR